MASSSAKKARKAGKRLDKAWERVEGRERAYRIVLSRINEGSFPEKETCVDSKERLKIAYESLQDAQRDLGEAKTELTSSVIKAKEAEKRYDKARDRVKRWEKTYRIVLSHVEAE